MSRTQGAMLSGLLLLGCGGRDAPAADPVLDSLPTADCPPATRPVSLLHVNLSRQEACALVARAWSAIASADSTTVMIRPEDTMAVRATQIHQVTQKNLQDSVLGSWWVVSFRLDGRPFDAEVQFDRFSGNIQLLPTHKPLGER
jgi:hypothetical protein